MIITFTEYFYDIFEPHCKKRKKKKKVLREHSPIKNSKEQAAPRLFTVWPPILKLASQNEHRNHFGTQKPIENNIGVISAGQFIGAPK